MEETKRYSIRFKVSPRVALLLESNQPRACLTPPSAEVLPLQPDVCTRIFQLLPVDTRLRCLEVSPAWRDFLASDALLWNELDMSDDSGVARRSTALLRAAAGRAGGKLRALSLSGWGEVGWPTVSAVVRENAATLASLSLLGSCRLPWWSFDTIFMKRTKALIQCLPQLSRLQLDADWYTDWADAHAMLSNAAPFAALQLREAKVWCRRYVRPQNPAFCPLSFCEAARAHHTLKALFLDACELGNAAALNAVVQLAADRLEQLTLSSCNLSPASLPALTALLMPSGLKQLALRNSQLFAGPAVPAFCAALSGCTLTHLAVSGLFPSLEDGLPLLAAITGHATLSKFVCRNSDASDDAARLRVGSALAALLSAESALTSLDVGYCGLSDVAVRPLFAALAASTRLRVLVCDNNGVSAGCFRDHFLPAVRANASLHEICLAQPGSSKDKELAKAHRIVRARAARATPR